VTNVGVTLGVVRGARYCGLGSSPRAPLATRFGAMARIRCIWGTPRTCSSSRRMGTTVAAGRGYVEAGAGVRVKLFWSSGQARSQLSDPYLPAQRGALNQQERKARSHQYRCNKRAGEGGRGVGDGSPRAPLAARFAALV
jgi:hypothetical protein